MAGFKSKNMLSYCIGGDLASTWVAKPEVHAENEISRTTVSKNINANDATYGDFDQADLAIAA